MITTSRLGLRHFRAQDLTAILRLFSDPEVNTFLPWFPLTSLAEAEAFYRTRLTKPQCYALCLKAADGCLGEPIGYINLSLAAPYDLGYALAKEYWHQGLVSEAAALMVARAKELELPYITATHDRANPRSGAVMQRIGMKYCYSYREQWLPKNLSVVFRLYQLNFTAPGDFVFMGYWHQYPDHMVETLS